MARHNREGAGKDQRDEEYQISYQPDWLSSVKVTRNLESGRQSTKTLFRNPGFREQTPGNRVRTRITSTDQGLDFEVAVSDPKSVIKRVIVETGLPNAREDDETVVFTLEEVLPPPPPPNGDDIG